MFRCCEFDRYTNTCIDTLIHFDSRKSIAMCDSAPITHVFRITFRQLTIRLREGDLDA